MFSRGATSLLLCLHRCSPARFTTCSGAAFAAPFRKGATLRRSEPFSRTPQTCLRRRICGAIQEKSRFAPIQSSLPGNIILLQRRICGAIQEKSKFAPIRASLPASQNCLQRRICGAIQERSSFAPIETSLPNTTSLLPAPHLRRHPEKVQLCAVPEKLCKPQQSKTQQIPETISLS